MKTKHFFSGLLGILGIVVLCSFVAGRSTDFQRFFQRSPETRANIITTVLKNRLDMDDSQVEKAYAINLKYAKRNQKLLEDKERPEISAEMIALNRERKEELKTLLSPVQQERAEKLRQKLINQLELILNQLKQDN